MCEIIDFLSDKRLSKYGDVADAAPPRNISLMLDCARAFIRY